MFKIMVLLKRRPGLTMDEFIEHYEGHHAQLGIKFAPNMIHYGRHYIRAIPDVLDGTVREPEYDVITEVHFENRASFEENGKLMQDPQALAELIADEEYLFDRSKKSRVVVEDHSSDLGTRLA
ncbi:EthD domain-containing protein [Rhodococcus qingshengii]|uniref:EthD domain-containing protein n=1 Tax=Rhodococcus qingshengii TaxID=334542 RepID=UPI0014560D09|nr:EthD domain-containing protein [Rhodococcus qingshengii]